METVEQILRRTKKVEPLFELHVHDDIDLLFEKTNIPIAFKQKSEVYIMQADKFVFVGTIKNAISFMERNRGEYCREFFPDVSVIEPIV